MVSIKILGGLNWFYGIPTSPSASVIAHSKHSKLIISNCFILKTLPYENFIAQNNRWKKKGMAVVPLKWGVEKNWKTVSVLVNIHSGDGSVLVNHGGVEMGQGINTKV